VSKLGQEILGRGEYAWFLLERIEDGLMEFADIIQLRDDPPHNHLEVFSRRIALKLYEVGTVAEGLFKEILEENLLDQSKNVDLKCLEKARRREFPFPDIRDFKNVLEPAFHLSRRSVAFRYFAFTKTLKPFSSFAATEGISPLWWDSYNEVKHDFFRNIDKVTLGRLVEGASAVFLLTVLCRAYWPALILNNRIAMVQRVGSTYRTAVSQELVYQKLHEAFFDERAADSITLPYDIVSNSRLFFAPLAVFSSNSGTYEIPQ